MGNDQVKKAEEEHVEVDEPKGPVITFRHPLLPRDGGNLVRRGIGKLNQREQSRIHAELEALKNQKPETWQDVPTGLHFRTVEMWLRPLARSKKEWMEWWSAYEARESQGRVEDAVFMSALSDMGRRIKAGQTASAGQPLSGKSSVYHDSLLTPLAPTSSQREIRNLAGHEALHQMQLLLDKKDGRIKELERQLDIALRALDSANKKQK